MPSSHPPSPTQSDLFGEIKSLKEVRVGVPRISEERIARVPIRIEAHDGLRAAFELQWRYPEGTLKPEGKSPANLENLFTLAALLPILNYLPFASSLVVDGPIDAGDAEWIGRLADATSREIQRQKLTPENPFLRTEALSHLHREALAIPPIRSNTARVAPAHSAPDPGAAGVTLDGSAEGILSWAVLREIGAAPLGIVFDNPSARMGAATRIHDYLAAHHPDQIVRIWTNLSHLYDFFLRHVDILRVNYQTIHADTTPIRLFEGEVGALAALPVLWSRRRGHLVVPRRTDSLERRPSGAAVPAQLPFDQTRAFDDYVSRFYGRKGWGIQQWTMLRPASEIVVQRGLATRYADLFPLQVACLRTRLEVLPSYYRNDFGEVQAPATPAGEQEAASEFELERGRDRAGPADVAANGVFRNGAAGFGTEDSPGGGNGHRPSTAGPEEDGAADGDGSGFVVPVDAPRNPRRLSTPVAHPEPERTRVIPCGACEACRRLVVIVTALGHDPKVLGYTPVKIERSLSHTRRVGNLPPEARIQRHVLYLLEQARADVRPSPDTTSAPRTSGDFPDAVQGLPPADAFTSTAAPADPSVSLAGTVAGRYEPHPEVESLRFDATRAFLDTIPLTFRKPTYAILLTFATGALRREGREWKSFDLLTCPEISLPKHPRDSEFQVT